MSETSNASLSSYQLFKERQKRGDIVRIPLLASAVTDEAKFKRNFTAAVECFDELLQRYKRDKLIDNIKPQDGGVYGRAICTIIRYAPTPEQAMYYAKLFFKEFDEPARTPASEIVVLTNLIYVYSRGTAENMDTSLDIVKLALSIGVLKIDPVHFSEGNFKKANFKDSVSVFKDVSAKVLKYHNVKISSDGTEVEPLSYSQSEPDN